MNLLPRCFRRGVSAALSLMIALPIQTYAYCTPDDMCYCVQQPMPCYVQEPCCSTKANPGVALGAILLGAAAGVGGAYAAKQNHHHHKSHDCCPPCPHLSCCKEGSCKAKECPLTFDLSSLVSVFFENSVGTYDWSIQYFVSTPNGCTILGDLISFTNQMVPQFGCCNGGIGSSQITPQVQQDSSALIFGDEVDLSSASTITVPACCGTYQMGFNFEITTSDEAAIIGVIAGPNASLYSKSQGIIFTNIVTDCHNNNVTTLLSENYEIFPTGLNQEIFNSFQFQFIIPYTYQPKECLSKSTCNCAR